MARRLSPLRMIAGITTLALLVAAVTTFSARPVRAAAARVLPPVANLVTLPAAECKAPASRVTELIAALLLTDWEVVGVDDARWHVRLDPGRATGLGITLPELRARVTNLMSGLAEGDPATAPEILSQATLATPKAPLPLSAVVTLERRPAPADVRLTLDGEHVVALTGPPRPPLLDTLRAALALAIACEGDTAGLRFEPLAAERTEWRLAYRTATGAPEQSFTLGRAVATKLMPALEGRVLVGFHRAAGGAIWGFRDDINAMPAPLPAPNTLLTPGVRLLWQGAARGRWSQPFLAVLRIEAPRAAAEAAYDTARTLSERAGSRNEMMLAELHRSVTFVPAAEQLAKHGLTAEDVAFLFPAAPEAGAAIALEVVRPGDPAKLRVQGAAGAPVALARLGTVEEVRRVEAAPPLTGDGVAIYVSVPEDTALNIARLLAETERPPDVRITQANWRVLLAEEIERILAWWQGLPV